MRRHQHAGRLVSDGVGISALSAADLDAIHHASLEVLERAGVYVEDDQALALFADAGCRIDKERTWRRSRRTSSWTRWRPARPPMRSAAGIPKNDFVMGSNRVGFVTFCEGILMNDIETGENRPSVKQDVARHHPPCGRTPGHRRRRVAGRRTRRR